MELVAEAKILLVHMKCEKCENGLMLPTGNNAFLTEPPQFLHKCNNCGNEETYRVQYPYQKLVPTETLRKINESESG